MTDAMKEKLTEINTYHFLFDRDPHDSPCQKCWLIKSIAALLTEVERLQAQQNANCLQRDALAIDLATLRRENDTLREALNDVAHECDNVARMAVVDKAEARAWKSVAAIARQVLAAKKEG